jgi:hypothetical protein
MVMCLPKRSLLYYAVDEVGRIVEVGQGWDNFADQNDASALSGTDIIGTPLWAYVSGGDTRDFVAEILDRVRTSGQPMTVRYRCDAPDFKRFMEMVITPREGGVVLLSHRILSEEPLPARVRFRTGPASDSVRCSMCNRVRHNGIWREPEEAFAASFLRGEHVNNVIYKVCDDCRRAVFGNDVGHPTDFA